MQTRRQFVGSSCAAALVAARGLSWAQAAVDFSLKIEPCVLELGPKKTVKTVAYNGVAPGPLLRVKQGRAFSVDVENRSANAEIVHWHGLLGSPVMDGAMEEGSPMIPAGASLRYALMAEPAGLRWYHTHTFAGTDMNRGQYTGQHGLLYVEPAEDAGRYDREFFLTLQDWRGQMMGGGDGSMNPEYEVSTINGKMLGAGEPLRVKEHERVLLHVVNVVLFFELARRLFGDRAAQPQAVASPTHPLVAPFVAAALFAVHPMMTEAVGYISARSEVLCATFFLLAVLSARRWMLGGPAAWWWLTAGLWVAALLSKEIAVMLPFVLFGYDRWILGGTPVERQRRRQKLLVPFAAIAIAAGLVRGAVFIFLEHPGEQLLNWPRAYGQLTVLVRYVALLVLPRGQAVFHDVVSPKSLFDAPALLGLLAIILLIGLAGRLRRSFGVASLGAVWFLLLLVPSSLLVAMNQGDGMSEHRVYLASCGLFMAAGAGVAWLIAHLSGSGRALTWLAGAAVGLELLSLAGATVLRNAVWADPVALWREASDQAPESWIPRTALGEALHEAGRHQEAIATYKIAVRLRPDEPFGYLKLGMCLAELRRFDEATQTFQELQLRVPGSTMVPIGRGVVAMMAGKADIARVHFRDAIRMDPRDVMARQWQAMLEEVIANNPAEALRLCTEVQKIAPATLGNDACIARNRARIAGTNGG